MRVTGGTLRNRVVRVIDRPGLRPTPARVREAVFHRLRDRLIDARVLDACGGSGILALEAWSRGARAVVCVERDRQACKHIARTVHALGADGISVRGRDARRLKLDPFDVILTDPPYADPAPPWVKSLAPLLKPDGVLVFEHRAGALSRGRHHELEVVWQRRYGDTEVSFLEPAAASPA